MGIQKINILLESVLCKFMIVFQEIHLHVIDLAHPRSVFQFTQEFREQFNCLDALVSFS